jgi:hypothetical protein
VCHLLRAPQGSILRLDEEVTALVKTQRPNAEPRWPIVAVAGRKWFARAIKSDLAVDLGCGSARFRDSAIELLT